MTRPQTRPTTQGAAALRRFLAPRAGTARPATERCDLCDAEVAEEHPHLVDVVGRTLRCACRPCALLFVDRPREMGGVSYRTVPDRYLYDPDFTLTDERWDALQIPVGMAFFLRSSVRGDGAGGDGGGGGGIVACYPSPAGATESELDLDRFADGVGAGRLGSVLEPDVEALLVRRDDARTECLLVPIDACYRLVGLVRMSWKGFDGGAEANERIDGFFDAARARARDVSRVRPGPTTGVRA